MRLTGTNLFVLRDLFGVADRIPNRIESVPHVRRLIAARLVVVDGSALCAHGRRLPRAMAAACRKRRGSVERIKAPPRRANVRGLGFNHEQTEVET